MNIYITYPHKEKLRGLNSYSLGQNSLKHKMHSAYSSISRLGLHTYSKSSGIQHIFKKERK